MTDNTRHPSGQRPNGTRSTTGRTTANGRTGAARGNGQAHTRGAAGNGGRTEAHRAGMQGDGVVRRRPSGTSGHSNSEKRAKEKKRRRNLLILEIVLLVILLIVLLIYLKVSAVVETDSDFDDSEIKEAIEEQVSEEALETLKGYRNIALFGVDDRKNGEYANRSDSIMIASINNDTGEVKIVSVYRDTYLDVGGGRYNKCNAAYSEGGPEQSIAMLNRNLDLNITDYVAVDFYALVSAIDAVGGIDLDITDEEALIMNYHTGNPDDVGYIDEIVSIVKGKNEDPSAYYVNSGHIHANGVQATAYCRIRYTAGDDFKRASRQREVLSKLVEKAKQANISEINKLINAMYGNVRTSLSLAEMLSMAGSMKDYTLADTTGFPFYKTTGTYGGSSLVVPCTLESNVVELYKYLFNDTAYVPSTTIVDHSDYIVNYTGCDESSAQNYQSFDY